MRTTWLVITFALVALAACPAPSGKDSGSPLGKPETAPNPSAGTESARMPLRVWADPALVAALEGLSSKFKKSYSKGYKLLPAESGVLPGAKVLAPSPKPPGLGGVTHPVADDAAAPPTPVATPVAPSEPADIYLFAGPLSFDGLRESQAIDEGSTRTFSGDRLVLVQMQGKGFVTPTLFDIYKLRFKALGTAKLGISLGDFTEQALISEGGERRIAKRRKFYDSSAALVKALQADEVQLAVIYASAAAQTPGLEVLLLVGADLHAPIRYQAVAATGRAQVPGVMELLAFLAEDPAVQQMFGSLGLQTRELVLHEAK